MNKQTVQYKLPEFDLKTFHCPNCAAYSKQRWSFPSMNCEGVGVSANENLAMTRCDN